MSITYTNAIAELTDSSAVHTVDSLFDLAHRVTGEIMDRIYENRTLGFRKS